MTPIIDTETIPGQALGLRDHVAKGVKPSASLKKAETLAAWERDDKPGLIDKAWQKTALDPLFGELVVIGALTHAGQRTYTIDQRLTHPRVIIRDYSGPASGGADEVDVLTPTEGEHPERLLLRTFFARQEGVDGPIGGWNVEFDLRFLILRALRHRLALPTWLPRLQPRFTVLDAMHLIGGLKIADWSTLADAALGLGLTPPVGRGDEVWGHVQAGNESLVAAHCASDLEVTASILALIRTLSFDPFWRHLVADETADFGRIYKKHTDWRVQP